MWQALEGFFFLIFAILLFGIISLPSRSKKERAWRIEMSIPKGVTTHRVLDNSVALQQAALGKEPRSYSSEQKTAADAPKQAKET
jgi:hypothetical protein